MSNHPNLLRLNVGFMVQQPVGSSREFIFDYPRLQLGPDLDLTAFTGRARISHTPQGLLVQATLEGEYPTECVRCLKEFSYRLHTTFMELYAFSPRNTDESGLILPEDGHLDLSPEAREYLLLEMPIRPLCRVDCQGLCPVCGENKNETQCLHEAEDIDPRLAILQKWQDG